MNKMVSTLDDVRRRRRQKEARLRQVLAYQLSGQRSYGSCDIPTRASIDHIITAVQKIYDTDH